MSTSKKLIRGSNNGRAQLIHIFNNNNDIMYICNGTILKDRKKI